MQRPPIPAEIKREVRQRCGFGCVLCGFPLYEYDHIREWSEVERHVADEITLLCRKHHGEKTNGLLPHELVAAANRDLHNKRTGVSKHAMLHYSGSEVEIRMGGSAFRYHDLPDGCFFAPLVVDRLPLIGFTHDQGQLLLHFVAFDESNSCILEIDDNELVYNASQWDIEWIAQTLTIREQHRKILLQIIFSPPNQITISKGRILLNGIEILLGRDYFFIANSQFFANKLLVENFQIGICIGGAIPNVLSAIRVDKVSRYKLDRKQARQHLRKYLNEERRRAR